MSGRLEHEQHLRAVAMNKIGNYPKVLRNFYEEFCAKQETSRMDMTYKVKRFWDYLESECKYDFSVQSNWEKVTTRDIKDWVKSIKFKTFKDGRIEPKSPRTIWDECKAVKKFFDYLILEKIIKENPWPTKVELDAIIGETTKEHVVTYMTLDEVDEVSDSIVDKSTEPCRDLCIFILGCRHGLRAQALSEIDVEDIDFENRILYVVEKGHKERKIRLDPDTMDYIVECVKEREMRIKEWGAGENLKALFIKNLYGTVRRISARHISALIRKNTDMLDKHITPHKMRATCITNTYELTGDIFTAARVAGHSNIENTKLYIDTTNKDIEVAGMIAGAMKTRKAKAR